MDHDSTDSPKQPDLRKARPGSQPAGRAADFPAPHGLDDIHPATAATEEADDEARLPDISEEPGEAVPETRLAVGHAAIEHAVRHAPTSPGVYRMLSAANDVLYVVKAKNVRKRLSSYARANARQTASITRMIAATAP